MSKTKDGSGNGGNGSSENNKSGNQDDGPGQGYDDNDIEVPSMEELNKLVDEISRLYVARASHAQRFQQGKGLDKMGMGDWMDMVREDVEPLKGKFEEFYTPGPGEFTAKLDAIDELTRSLDTRQGDYNTGVVKSSIHEAMDHMEAWQGELGLALRKEYLSPMYESIIPNHGRMIAVMHDNFQAMRNIYAEARRSLKKIGENGVTAMEAADDANGKSVVTALTVLIAAFGVGVAALAALPAVATTAGITGAVVTGGLSIAADQAPEAEDIELSGNTVQEVLSNIYGALEKLSSEVSDKENELIKTIVDGVDDLVDNFGDMSKSSLLIPEIPDLATTAVNNPHDIPEKLISNNA